VLMDERDRLHELVNNADKLMGGKKL